MNPVISCSAGNVSLIPGTALSTRKNNTLTILSLSRKSINYGSATRRLFLPQFVSIGLFSQNKSLGSFHKKSITPISATETEVAVEEPGSPVAEEDYSVGSETTSDEVGSADLSPKSDTSPAPVKSGRPRYARKSEMPPIKNEDLIPGATFTGKVKSIQPFGAFVDFGAFTDGLIHVSRLSDSYVKDVASVVCVGQEVKVRLIEVNTETQRISLSMRESDGISKLQQKKDEPISAVKAGPGRRNTSKSSPKKDDVKKSTKFVKGQDLEGTVKNMIRSGAFITLPEGEEGFLPISEESDEGFGNVMGTSSLQVGQEVNVRVLRITRGQVTLTMKKEEDNARLDSELNQGVVHVATNPFVLAFRNNKDIAAFLNDRMQKTVEKPSTARTSEEFKETVMQVETALDVPDVPEKPESRKKLVDSIPSAIKDNAEDKISESEEDMGASTLDDASKTVEDERDPVSNINSPVAPEGDVSAGNQFIEDATQTNAIASDVKTDSSVETANESAIESGVDHIAAEDEKQFPTYKAEEELAATPTDNNGAEINPDKNGSIVGFDIKSSAPAPKESADRTEDNDQVLSPEDHSPEVFKNSVDNPKEVEKETPATENENSLTSEVEDEEVGIASDKNSSLTSLNGQTGLTASAQGLSEDGAEGNDQVLSAESHSPDVIENLIDNPKEERNQTPVYGNEVSFTSQVGNKEVGIGSAKNSCLSNENGQNGFAASEEGLNKATISPALVKQLREETGAGMMDCKNALSETEGDIIKAQEFLRKKGLASAEKKASRATAEGRIGSYIHDSRIGVLVEVNCETDFVSRGEIFKELVDDIAMQVAACPQVQYLVIEDVLEEIVNKEKEIEMQKEDLLSKPEQIRSKIVEGRIRKRLEELALLEQPYIKNDKVAVKDWVKQTIATIGENIKVKRFVRFNLGEGLDQKSQDFAAEVAAQTAAKPVPTAGKEQRAIIEAKETEQKPSAVAISAALVKQLREETGAGMMDCKKALAEAGGDLEKAQEYLRKKGLSSADKKASRLAAEGRIGSYIHDSRIGVLIEVNCETDFVGRSEKFKELVEDLAMQVVACPQVLFVSVEDIPESIVNREKELEMQREDLASKPENIRERIVEGRVSKRLGEVALLEQPFIKDDSVLVKDLVKQTVAAIGENIKVRRFIRFTLGETAESETIAA